jgi:hypothetical protein
MTHEIDDQIRLYLTETGKNTDKYYLTVEYVGGPSANVAPIFYPNQQFYDCTGVSVYCCVSVSVYFLQLWGRVSKNRIR